MDQDSKKQHFIYGDLNDLGNGKNYLPLRNQKIINAIKNRYTQIDDGLQIWLFSPTYRNNKLDPTIFPGEIRPGEISGEFEIHVNENEMEYLSESEKFKDYSIEDVIGTEWAKSLK